MSVAKELGIAIAARLAQIKVADGYLTDIGMRVYRGRRKLDPEMVPCVVLIEGDDRAQDSTAKNVALSQRYIAEAHLACDPDNPNDAAHDAIEDLKTVVWAGDITFGKRVRSVSYQGRAIGAREDGLAIVSGRIEFDVLFAENLAAP